MTYITLSHSLLSQLRNHAREDYPREACGVIGGVGTVAQIALPIPNVDADPLVRYTMDGRSLVEAIFRLRKMGLDVIAFYHSHPNEAAIPSATDIAEATWLDAAYVIVGREGSEVRAWRIVGGGASEVEVRVEDAD
ncbi:MAG: M67 family metallopeptidase [Anaerolineae bacterium]